MVVGSVDVAGKVETPVVLSATVVVVDATIDIEVDYATVEGELQLVPRVMTAELLF